MRFVLINVLRVYKEIGMNRLLRIIFILSYVWGACPDGFYEDDNGTCWMPYCYDYVSHAVSYDTDEVDCTGPTEMWVIPGSEGDPYWNSYSDGNCPGNYMADDCGHCWSSFCYSFFSPGLNGDPAHSVYYDLSIDECEGYGYNYYSPDHPSNPYWNSNCTTDCNGVVNGDAMLDDCGDCQSGYCYDYVTHEVSFGACDGATQMWVDADSPSNPYWNASCPECGTGDANNDGTVNVTDIIVMIDTILSGGQPEDLCAFDCNFDGILNVTDVVAVVNIILND